MRVFSIRRAYRVSLTTAVAIALMGLALPVAHAEPDGYQPQLTQSAAVTPDGYQPQLRASLVVTTPDGYQPQLQGAQPTAVILRAGEPDGYQPSLPTIISFPAQVITDDFAWWTGALGLAIGFALATMLATGTLMGVRYAHRPR
jgi:hypothetical protein